jgi:hypothetical protein
MRWGEQVCSRMSHAAGLQLAACCSASRQAHCYWRFVLPTGHGNGIEQHDVHHSAEPQSPKLEGPEARVHQMLAYACCSDCK